ncbi:MAG: RNA polymerase sigma factor [Candidatus Krumholzibacteriia bacterium]
MDEESLTGLAEAFQLGDLQSFRVLVEALTRPLIAMAYRYTGDWESARDLCQETWIKVHETIRRFDPGRPFSAWLFAIHRNGCLSHLRQAAVRRERPVGPETMLHLSPVDVNPGPREKLLRNEFMARVQRAVAELSESQQRVFVLVDLEQMDQKAVARALDMKPPTVRTTLHFARKRLAKILRRSRSRNDHY